MRGPWSGAGEGWDLCTSHSPASSWARALRRPALVHAGRLLMKDVTVSGPEHRSRKTWKKSDTDQARAATGA
jgi:hypothetical protein